MNLKCGKCGIINVKIFRPYGKFYREENNRCGKCIQLLDKKIREWYVPCIEDIDGTIWGHASVPKPFKDKFNKLPDNY